MYNLDEGKIECAHWQGKKAENVNFVSATFKQLN